MAVAALIVYVRVQLRRLGRWAKSVNESSRAVQQWAPGAGERMKAGPLGTRVIRREHAESSVVLLHGLGTSGDYFGHAWDELSHDSQLVVPDLLGFGRSRDTSLPARAFALAGHLDALDRMLADTVPDSHQLVIVGHSFGGLLALHLAARHVDRVRGVVLIATPFHDSYESAEHHIVSRSAFNKYFTIDRYIAQFAARFLVRYPIDRHTTGTTDGTDAATRGCRPVTAAVMERVRWLAALPARRPGLAPRPEGAQPRRS